MTHDEAYVATVRAGFDRQFGRELTFTTNATETTFERADGKLLTKKQVAFLDGVTAGFWTRHKPDSTRLDAVAANALRERCARVCYAMADKAKSVSIRNALSRAGAAILGPLP